MAQSPDAINALIRSRRSTAPENFSGAGIRREILLDILENARWAPNHKMTQPWRFIIFREKALNRLASYMGTYYREHTPQEQFREEKLQKTREKVLKSACVIVLCLKRSQGIEIPEWEEIAALACAVENIWIGAAGYGLGGYWSTPESILQAGQFLDLEPSEFCLGLFYLGHPRPIPDKRKRQPLESLVRWAPQ